MKESNRCNGLEHVPACSTWPPPWLTSAPAPAPPPRVVAEVKRHEPPPDASPRELPPDLFTKWEERVCIMHFDGKIPWQTAEALALADVLGKADPESAKAEQPAPVVQMGLFAADPYG